MAKVVIFLITLSCFTYANVEVRVNPTCKIVIQDYEYALPLNMGSYMLKSQNSRVKPATLSVNQITPMGVKELTKFIELNTGKKGYEIIKVGESHFYKFFSDSSIFFYSTQGKLIQVHSTNLKEQNVSIKLR